MAKKNEILGGLDGLLNPNRPTATPTAEPTINQEPARDAKPLQIKNKRGTTVRVCYNLNADIIAKVKAIANYDRKNINEVFNEALQSYIDKWEPTPQEPPKF
jgi:hypothetical protein